MNVLVERLRTIDKSISRMTAERLKVLAEIAKLDAEDGASERQTASRVARLTSSTPKQAAGELAMAKQISALPAVADAHAKGEISNSQLAAVTAIASASSESEALALAKSGTSSQLQQRAAASRGKLFEARCKAQTGRYLAFKPEDDGQSTRIHGRLPFAESKHLEMQLRKIADRLGLRDKQRPSPSARMADALLILTKNNPSQALHDHEEQTQQQAQQSSNQATTSNSASNQPTHNPTTNNTTTNNTAGNPKPVIDYDEDPFPEIDNDTNSSAEFHNGNETDDRPDNERGGNDGQCVNQAGNEHDSAPARIDQIIVQRADTRLIIHWNAQSGAINFENGPPIDHPRLQALLCDAQIDIQHCDTDGLPTGLITTAHHSSWRQDRYLAFRDGPCRIPECDGIGKTQAHHIFEDRLDRITSVEYMINFCNRCHQEHHDGNFTIAGKPEQTITFTYKNGTTLSSTPRPAPNKLKQPKPIPLSKHQPEANETDLFAKSA